MAKLDPTEGLKRFVNRLKKQKPKDCRKPRPVPPPGVRPRTEYGRHRASLLHPWQVWEYLLMDRKEPCQGRDDFHNFAPPYWVDENTLMITTPSVIWAGWCVRIIWPVGEDYCVRVLTDEEIATISNLNHSAIRQAFGFTARQPKWRWWKEGAGTFAISVVPQEVPRRPASCTFVGRVRRSIASSWRRCRLTTAPEWI